MQEPSPPALEPQLYERVDALRRDVADLFAISDTTLDFPAKGHIRFHGQFLRPPADCFDELRRRFERHGYTPMVDEEADGRAALVALPVVFAQHRPRWIINLVLLLLTIGSTLYVGASYGLGQAAPLAQLLSGWPFAVCILLILGAHEMGHYVAARRHNVPVTLPFFIPLPFWPSFGTLGAFIQLRGPVSNRRGLFDVGAAGPLAGLVFAVPVLLYGLATSDLGPITPGQLYEGNSILYLLGKLAVFGRILPGGGRDVYLNQVAWAGWVGLFVTGLNLLPVGQLDGGHVSYALFGERSRHFLWPVIIALALIVVYSWLQGAPALTWVLWIFLLMTFGRVHARPLEDITPLDPRRRALAVFTLALFFLCFVPLPLVAIAR
jgi:membrane-associated protease RseP (regulator of RpoE activity)